jgi:cysteine desulfurase family protein (TIGR01976 family)
VTYDVERVRSDIPALAAGAAHFDGPGGTQVAGPVADAVAATMRSAVSNRGTVTSAEQRANQIVRDARAAAADLLGSPKETIAFGRSMTALSFVTADALSQHWHRGEEVIVTSLDHDANVTPWQVSAERAGAIVRMAEFDPETGALATKAVTSLLTDRTRLVAVTGAANLIGTRPDISAIAAAAHGVGADLAVDGVHLTPHAVVDVGALGADLFFCSPYKFCGPHFGILTGRADLLESLRPIKLAVSSNDVPERFELGTLPYELLAGLTAGIDWLAGLAADPLDSAAGGAARRERIVRSMTAVKQHESRLHERLEAGLRSLPGVRLHGAETPDRTPTTLFTVEGHGPASVHMARGRARVNAPAGHFYARTAAQRLGLGEVGGIRAGLAPYTNEDDVDRLLSAVADIAV